MCTGNPVTVTVEIAERNPSGSKGAKPSTGIAEIPEPQGPTDLAGSRRASHGGGGTEVPAVVAGNEVTGITPTVTSGQTAGDHFLLRMEHHFLTLVLFCVHVRHQEDRVRKGDKLSMQGQELTSPQTCSGRSPRTEQALQGRSAWPDLHWV